MTTNNQMMQFLSMLATQKDSKNAVLNMIRQNAGNNPMLQNLMTLGINGDSAQVEAIARNICKEKGVDFDTEFNSFKNNLGL